MAPQFFLFLALAQAWELGVGIAFGDGFGLQGVVNIIAGLVFLALARARGQTAHVAGTAVSWLILLTSLTLEGLGIVM